MLYGPEMCISIVDCHLQSPSIMNEGKLLLVLSQTIEILFYNYLCFSGILCGKLIWSLFPFTMIHKTFWFEMWKHSAQGYFKLNVIGCKLFHVVLKLIAVDKCENSFQRINLFVSYNITFNTQNFCNKEIETCIEE